MSTFCRITGKSRGLPKPNYFPLLPPISPADAKRFCRITGKAYGLPSHHYIPVLVGTTPKKRAAQAPIPTPQGSVILTKKHVLLSDYRYVFPVCEDSSDLIQILATKDIESNAHYVYKVGERRCSLVFNAKMEAAVRDGDIRNVMLAKDSDTLLLKLKRGGDVAVDVKDIAIEGLEIYDGEGPSEEVVNQRPKRKRTGSTGIVRKIFEDKERAADIAEETEVKKPKVIKMERKKDVSNISTKPQNWREFQPEKSNVIKPVSSEVLKPLFENLDWENLGKETATQKGSLAATAMPTPSTLVPQQVDLGSSLPGLVQSPVVMENTTGFETTIAIMPLTPLIAEPDKLLQEAIRSIDSKELIKTAHVEKVFTKQNKNLNLLPSIDEIPELMGKIHEGIHSSIESGDRKVHGLKLDIKAAEKFIVGLSVDTPQGLVFVPGQTVSTPNGEMFLPGVTVHTPEGAKLIPGQAIEVEDKCTGIKTPVFIAGQTLVTREGEKFVPGQTLMTKEGLKFVPGQTVLAPDSPKFVPGQIIKGEAEEGHKFIPGLTELDSEGHRFVPGQMHKSESGHMTFVPGQSELTETGWDFVPGQSMVSQSGEVKFVPGQTIETKNESCFVPGQTVNSETGESCFVPGVIVDAESGPSFIPGANVDTPNGPQFVEGQIFKSESGKFSFVPGRTAISDDGSYQFAAASKVSEIVFRDNMPLGISISSPAIHTTDKSDVIYGHMVQTSQGVEFFPGVASGLPAGKVVPGRLVRGKEVKFVPGVLIDGKFVPGQVVTTDQGEQFIPGQVVETQDGPKFVPGQVVETRSGSKFIPGQTVDTAEGPKFVPGQIVETKAGPTFIPGQVISTDDEGSRFVPGQVVETVEGPRFVPGRVIETGDNVTFIPGQVVETSEGLKFIAPDLQDDPEGDIQFTVQGFSITPEELSLLRPHMGSTSIFSPASGETAIDSRMMRQLSEAGMAVGRQVPADVPVVDVRTVPAMGIACSLAEKLHLDAVTTIKLSQILATVADLDGNVPVDGQAIMKGYVEEALVLKSMMKAASVAESDFAVYTAVCSVLERLLRNKPDKIISFVDNLHRFVTTSEALAPLRRQSKISLLRDIIEGNVNGDQDIVERLSSVLSDSEAAIIAGFKHFSEGNPEFVEKLLRKVSDCLSGVATEKDASDSLQRAIIDIVRESSELSVQELLQDSIGIGMKNLFLEAIGLARALGMRDVAATLLDVISDPKNTEMLAGDRVTWDILKRLTVMRQLAEKRPNFKSALGNLQSDPELARSDPLLRELVRESGALMIVPEEAPLIQCSSDIPTSLLQTDNSLAMEDFMLRNQRHGILLIIKHGLQAVIPRDAARAVLTGQVPYTVLDERGIHHFAPLHVFSALHLPRMYTHRFSMYSVQTEDEVGTLGTLTPGSSTSMEDVHKIQTPTATIPDIVSEEGGEVIFSVNQDYLADDLDTLSLHRGEQVIVLESSGGGDPSNDVMVVSGDAYHLWMHSV